MTEDTGRIVNIYPTEGGYQRNLSGIVTRETKTCIFVKVEGFSYDWKFSKSDLLRSGAMKNVFPRYQIEA